MIPIPKTPEPGWNPRSLESVISLNHAAEDESFALSYLVKAPPDEFVYGRDETEVIHQRLIRTLPRELPRFLNFLFRYFCCHVLFSLLFSIVFPFRKISCTKRYSKFHARGKSG